MLAAVSAAVVHRRLVRPLKDLAAIAARAAADEEESEGPAPTGRQLAPLVSAVGALVEEVERSRSSVLARAILEGSTDLT